MRDWYRSLEPRDRRAVLFGGGLLLAAAVWLLLLGPLYLATETSASRYVAAEQRFARMQAIGQNAARLGGMPSVADMPFVDRVRQMLPSPHDGSGAYNLSALDSLSVRLRADTVSYSEWMRILVSLQAQHVRIDAVDMQSLDGGTGIRASATLSAF